MFARNSWKPTALENVGPFFLINSHEVGRWGKNKNHTRHISWSISQL
jgi:hypothetical protein